MNTIRFLDYVAYKAHCGRHNVPVLSFAVWLFYNPYYV